MRQMTVDTEAIRLMLIMRRRILSEFGEWISVDDENAPTAIRDYGLKSKDESLRKMANQLGLLIGQSPTAEPETLTLTKELHYYRGTLVHKDEPARQATDDKPKVQAQTKPAAKPKEPAKRRFYRGQVIKS
jgi:hypothetical protein